MNRSSHFPIYLNITNICKRLNKPSQILYYFIWNRLNINTINSTKIVVIYSCLPQSNDGRIWQSTMQAIWWVQIPALSLLTVEIILDTFLNQSLLGAPPRGGWRWGNHIPHMGGGFSGLAAATAAVTDEAAGGEDNGQQCKSKHNCVWTQWAADILVRRETVVFANLHSKLCSSVFHLI